MASKMHEIDVQPIRSQEQIKDMLWALDRHCSRRDYIMFLMGINTGLRVSDLLALETQQILALRKKKQKKITVKEGKTKKQREINLQTIYAEVITYAETNTSRYLFPSRKGDKAITKIQAYRQLQKAAEFAGIESVGTHTMRKTFGYWLYKQTKDIALLQEILNHSKPSITLTYIGINQEEKDKVLDNFCLGL